MRTIDISGMGGGYENVCQKMLWAGVDFLKNEPGEIKFKEFRNIYGVIDSSGDAKTQRLEDCIVNASGSDCTGAMVQAVMGHLRFISINGLDKWLAEFEDKPENFFEWDGSAKSCPKTDISEKMDDQG